MLIGLEWVIDAEGCQAAALADLSTLRQLCRKIIADLGLCVVGEPLWHAFPPPGGVTGIYLLSESHLACHTFPEHGLATFNLYCCRPREAWPWNEQLQAVLGARQVLVGAVPRGAGSDDQLVLSSTAQFPAHAAPRQPAPRR